MLLETGRAEDWGGAGGFWSVLADILLGQGAGILLINVALGRQPSDRGFTLGASWEVA
jgi:hypothetical protein